MIGSRILVSALAAGALLLSACSAGAPGGSSADGIQITFWHSASGPGAQVVDKAVANFNAAHQGKIKVTATYQGTYDDAITKLANAVQAKNTPNVMQVNDTNTQYMIDTKLTVSAADLNNAAETKIDLAGFAPAVSKYYTVGGSLRSVPFQVSQPVLFLNPTLIKAAGLDIKNPPKTFAEVFSWAKQAQAKTGKAGFVTHINPWWFEQLTASAGINYCTPDNGVGSSPATKFVLTDPAQIAQWTGMQQLYSSKVALNVGSDFNGVQTAFANGDAAIMLGSTGAYGNLKTNAKFDVTVAPLPLDSAKGGAVPGGNSAWVFGSDAKGATEQAAWAFASYLASDAVQTDSFSTSGYLPNTLSSAKLSAANASEAQKVMLAQLARPSDSTAALGCHSGALQAERAEVQKGLEAILVSGSDVATTLKGVEDKTPGLIDAYNQRAGK